MSLALMVMLDVRSQSDIVIECRHRIRQLFGRLVWGNVRGANRRIVRSKDTEGLTNLLGGSAQCFFKFRKDVF
jgi:hypothetical protein